MKKYKVKYGKPYPLGAHACNGGTNFSMVNSSDEECGIILYKKGVEQKQRIAFDNNHKIGNISCLFVENLSLKDYEYNYYIGDNIFVDPYATKIYGNEKWRGGEFTRPMLRGGLYDEEFEWENIAPLQIPYSDSIMYLVHVRGFTKHRSSGVKHKGTFEGIIEKIPYLKELGINAIELMPAYEFEECEWESEEQIEKINTIEYQVSHFDQEITEAEEIKAKPLNYWGYRNANYFAPKASYAASSNPGKEFKRMVQELHRNGIEVIMQFYFPNDVKQGYIIEILKHWVLEYRIDGMHLKGALVPVTLIATEPLFANTKIMCEGFNLDDIYPNGEQPVYRNLGYYRDEFMLDIRKYLKGDHDRLQNFQYHMTNYNPKCGVINYVTNYYGFTLNDLVSYERKHNEANGENNTDGTDYNYSWNCGVEGPSRKRVVVQLRKSQMKNAMSFLFAAQGTPLLMAGDEFGNSKNGNNNSYCQDNEIGWVNWKGLQKNADLYEYTKKLIAFRKVHKIMHLEEGFTMLDRYGYGCPDLSYHSEDAWRTQLESYNRHISMMYCGNKKSESQKDMCEPDYVYIAYNMHWDEHKFALPSVSNYKWVPVMTTVDNDLEIDEKDGSEYIKVKPRSIAFMVGKKIKKTSQKVNTKLKNV